MSTSTDRRLSASAPGDRAGARATYRELARRSGSTLELGAGTGRVALELGGLTDLMANDVDEQLLEELVRRAGARGVTVTPVLGDATKLDLGRRFELVLAPAGFAQTVGGPDTRQALLRVIKRHLAVTGLAVVAISDVEEVLRDCTTPAPSRQIRARGRTFICQQLPATEIDGGARVTWKRAVRQRIAGRPARRSVEPVELTHHRVSAEQIAAEARPSGLQTPHVHHDPGDAESLGSTYCVLRHAPPSGV